MSSSVIDKENSTGLFQAHVTNQRKFGDSLGGNTFNKVYSTPQQKVHKSSWDLLKSKSIQRTGTEKRRALGDLLNTTKTGNRQSLNFNCNTPKANLINSKIGTPSNKCIKKLTSDFERQSIGLPLKSETREAEIESYPPVEKCIHQNDNFTDLFEETGKLSEIFLNKNLTYVPRMPTGKAVVVDSFHEFDIYTDKTFEKEVKEMNKSIKTIQKQEKSECLDNLQELPVLELPPILEDFDLTLDDSFDN